MRLEREFIPAVAATAVLALGGCGTNEIADNPAGTDVQPNIPHETAPHEDRLPSHVLEESYDNGVRIVEFKPKGSVLLLHVVEFCDGDTQIRTINRVTKKANPGDMENRVYNQKNTILVDVHSKACKDGELTPEDKLPIPKIKRKEIEQKTHFTSA